MSNTKAFSSTTSTEPIRTSGTSEVEFKINSTVTPSFWFFPDILGDGRSISISSDEAQNVEEAEQLARQKLEGDAIETA